MVEFESVAVEVLGERGTCVSILEGISRSFYLVNEIRAFPFRFEFSRQIGFNHVTPDEHKIADLQGLQEGDTIVMCVLLTDLGILDELVRLLTNRGDPSEFFLRIFDGVLGFLIEIKIFKVAARLETVE